MWQKLCMTKSALNPRQANSFNSSLVIAPVVSCEPTEVTFGSQYVPGLTPTPAGKPQARPTIFCASVNPFLEETAGAGVKNRVLADNFKNSLALDVNPRPIIRGILPPARYSSASVNGIKLNVAMDSFLLFRIFPSNG